MCLVSRASALGLLLLAATAVMAAPASKMSGPLNITADSSNWEGDVLVATGNVVAISKTLELRGDHLELRQTGGKKNPYEITLTGDLATMKHLGEQPGDPVTNGRGQKLVYRSKDQSVELTGTAHLDRGKDELNGEQVTYVVPARRVQASGGAKGQVHIVLDTEEAQAEQKKRKDGKQGEKDSKP